VASNGKLRDFAAEAEWAATPSRAFDAFLAFLDPAVAKSPPNLSQLLILQIFQWLRCVHHMNILLDVHSMNAVLVHANKGARDGSLAGYGA
jgi:hypothetical protein